MNYRLDVRLSNFRCQNEHRSSEISSSFSEVVSTSRGCSVSGQSLDASVLNMSIEKRSVSTATVNYDDLIELANKKINIVLQEIKLGNMSLNITSYDGMRTYFQGGRLMRAIIQTLNDRDLTNATKYNSNVKTVFDQLIDRYLHIVKQKCEQGAEGATTESVVDSISSENVMPDLEKCLNEALVDGTGSMNMITDRLKNCRKRTLEPFTMGSEFDNHYALWMAIPKHRERAWKSSYLLKKYGDDPLWQPLIELLLESPFYPNSILGNKIGKADVVTCFSCGLSLSIWDINDNPIYEQAGSEHYPDDISTYPSALVSASRGHSVSDKSSDSSVLNRSKEGKSVSTPSVNYDDLVDLVNEKINVVLEEIDLGTLSFNTTLSDWVRIDLDGSRLMREIIRAINDKDLTNATKYNSNVNEMFGQLIDRYINLVKRKYEQCVDGATTESVTASISREDVITGLGECLNEALMDGTGSMKSVKCRLKKFRERALEPYIFTFTLGAECDHYYAPWMVMPKCREKAWKSSYLLRKHGDDPLWQPLIKLLLESPFYPNSVFASKKGKPDLSTCFACGLSLSDWEFYDNPADQHALYYYEKECGMLQRIRPQD